MRGLFVRSLKEIYRIAPFSLVVQVVCMLVQSILVAANTWVISVFLNSVYTENFKTGMLYLGIIWGVFIIS